MGGEKAQLIHADPPYGMGKENEGIANDNLYRDKLDVFQMQWWKAARPHVEDNASAYIWGNAEDLWRLWYRGGLADSERVTFRNEVVWDKGGGGFGVGTEAQRCYFPEEHCLFFMLGEQGFNNNSDNYWEGWEGMRGYLESEMKRCGWSVSDLNRITGTQMGSHWVTKSQWVLITEQHYKKIQEAAREHAAFKREHDELKRDYYSTRAYFDNTHDNMTDVWEFGRVTGDDRHGHATPKPVDMVARAIKSSCPEGGITYAPFAGTSPEIVACQNTGRKCYTSELSPAYGAVILQRMITAFPDIDIYKAE
jgi:DNA modification methylase